MAQNPNINWKSSNDPINVNGTIINAGKLVDAAKYSQPQPVDPNSTDPLIKRLSFSIDSGSGKIYYIDTQNGNATFDNLNEYAKSPAIIFAGYDAYTTQKIQYAMQKNLAVATNQAVPTGAPPTPPASSGQFGLPTGKDFKDILTEISTNFGAGDEEPRPIYIYPVDAIYSGKNSNQDYLQISKYRYNPPYAESLFTDPNILKTGLKRGEATQEKLLGQVLLPIPNNIADSNNVAWADDNMNNLSAAALNLGLNDPGALGLGAGIGGLLGLLNMNPVGGAQKGAASALYYKLLQAALGSDNPNAKTIGTAAGASRVLSMAGFQISPESILARGAGVIPNSNLELLFNAPTIREFQFQYRLSPRSSGEADEVKHIIKFFKRGMAPKKQNSTSGSGSSYFLGTPNVFKLNYKTSGSKEIDGVNKIKTCAMTGFSVNYAADGSWAAYDGGQPVSYILNMSFKELEPVYDADYDLSDSTVGY